MPAEKPRALPLVANLPIKVMAKKMGMRSAVVGLGRIGLAFESDPYREKPASHVGAINDAAGVSLVAACDVNAKARATFAKQFPHIPVYANILHMLNSTKVDCLHIATPTSSHLSIFTAALQVKIPLLVLEKPLASNLQQANKMQKLLQLSGAKVVLNHERRFASNYCKVQNYIQKNTFGPLLSVWGTLAEETTTLPYQVLLHDGTHMVDIVRFLCGASSLPQKKNVLQSGEIKLFCANSYGAMLHLHYLQQASNVGKAANAIPITLEIASGRKYFSFELKLFFSAGVIEIGNGIFNVWHSKPSKFYKGFRSLEVTALPWQKTHYFSAMVTHTKKLFLNKEQPRSSFSDGMAVLQLLNAVQKKLK